MLVLRCLKIYDYLRNVVQQCHGCKAIYQSHLSIINRVGEGRVCLHAAQYLPHKKIQGDQIYKLI